MSADSRRDALIRILARIRGRRVCVIGDAILDRYLIGRSERLSREAPVPVLELQERRQLPGGAANPAVNLAALGAVAHLVSATGADEDGAALRSLLAERDIDAKTTLPIAGRETTVKTRILARSGLRSPQQLARLDRGGRQQPLTAEAEEELRAALASLPALDALLCSDYGGGALSDGLRAAARARAERDGALLTADAQSQLARYHGFDLVKCNANEAAAELDMALDAEADFAQAAGELRTRLDCGALVITRGAAGATLARRDKAPQHFRAPAVTDVYDTVGAGDTAIAMMTAALAAGADTDEAVELANLAGGIVVRHFGNYAPAPAEIAAALA